MLIEIESVYGDKIIHGRHLDMNELKNAIDEILKTVNEENFVFAFCSRYKYEEMLYSDDIRIDYVIDLDTHLLLKTKYE